MMIAGLLFLGLALAPPQATSPEFERGAPDKLLIHETTDEAGKARKYLDDVSRCIASHHRRESAAALALPYGSAEQSAAVTRLMQVEDSCFGPIFSSMSIHFEPQGLAAGMAEFFLANPKALDDARRRDPKSFVWAPEDGMDQFGHCVVSQNNAAARAFIDTPVASAAEQSAAQALAPELAQCISEGQTIAIEPASMRQVLAVALYRQVAVPPSAVVVTDARPAKP